MEEREEVIVVANEYFGHTFKRRRDGQQVMARLVREPGNKHDRNAVAVFIDKGQQGYLSAARAEKIAPWIDAAGGAYATEVMFRDGMGFVFIPRMWLGQKAMTVAVQQAKKYQEQLDQLGTGIHKATVEPDGDQMNVLVGRQVIGRLYPKKESPETMERVSKLQTIDLEVQPSSFSDGLYGRLRLPAVLAKPSTPNARSHMSEVPAPEAKPAAGRGSVFSRLADRFRS